MSEGGGGFNHNLWSQQNLGQKAGGDDVDVNNDEIGKLPEVASERAISTATKAIPVVGQFIPTNPGKVSMFAGLESEGIGNKPINVKGAGMLDASGGVLAKFAGDLIKNGSIPGGSPYGEGSGDGSGGGGDSGGGTSGNYDHHFASSFEGLDSGPIIAAGGGNHFEVAHMSERSLGELHPSFTPSVGGHGIGASVDI